MSLEKKIVVTGGAGFMGSHFLRLMVNKYPEHHFINLDKLTYAGNLDNVKDLENKSNYEFVMGDICDSSFVNYLLRDIDVVFNFAAETHVDNSLQGSIDFTRTDALGLHTILESVKRNNVKKLIHMSTDEVYGEVTEGSSKEEDHLNPTNPYAGSKAAGEMLIKGYQRTWKTPVIVVRGSNNIGPNQYPEKITARFVTLLLQDKKIPLHGTGENLRTFVDVEDFARAVDVIYRKGKIGEAYNVGTDNLISNIELTKKILKKLGKDDSYIEFVPDRPFNDGRYHVDCSKLQELGWKPEYSFEESLDRTIEWFKNNREWWEKVYKNMKPVWND